MSNPCKLDDTTQNKIAYAMGYENGRAEVISEVESIMKKYATYENVDVFVEVLRELKKE